MKSRDDVLERVVGQIEMHVERGANITESQRAFLEEAAWQSYRKNRLRKRPQKMTNAQRKMKHDMIERWREGLENLFLIELPLLWGEAWIREKDLERILDFGARLSLLRLCISHFGREYGDLAISELKGLYRKEKEKVVIIRGLDSI